MKIKYKKILEYNMMQEMSIEEFADQENLVINVFERVDTPNKKDRFFAYFERCKVFGAGIIIALFGNGATPEEAIADYAKIISQKIIVIQGSKGDESVTVPRLIVK